MLGLLHLHGSAALIMGLALGFASIHGMSIDNRVLLIAHNECTNMACLPVPLIGVYVYLCQPL